MDDYLKERYTEVSQELRSTKSELEFYQGIVYRFSGAIGALIYIVMYVAVVIAFNYCFSNWRNFTPGDWITLVGFISATIIGFIRYKKWIFNWPEELYLQSRRDEKERDSLKKDTH